MSDQEARGTCFGFSVRSALPLLYLRGGTGDVLAVEWSPDDGGLPQGRLVCEWQPRRQSPLRALLYEDGPAYRFWVEGTGTFVIEPEAPRIVAPNGASPAKRESRIWGIPALLCFLARGEFPLHAAAVEVEGRAVVLAAPGTFGKTTLAAAFARAGHRVLSEDITCIRLEAEPAVIPGPAGLRLRRDVATQLDARLGAERDGDDGRVHIALDRRFRGDCAPVPLCGIVLLRVASEGISVVRARTPDVIRDLWSLSFALARRAEQGRCFVGCSALASRVPTWNLSRPLRIDELDAVVERVASCA